MSTANAIVPHTQQIAQEAPPNTGLYGVAPGKYQAYLNGQLIDTVYAVDHNAAYPEFHRLLNEHKTGDPQIDWMPCLDCGYVLDLGEDCPSCGSVTVFASGIEWEVSR